MDDEGLKRNKNCDFSISKSTDNSRKYDVQHMTQHSVALQERTRCRFTNGQQQTFFAINHQVTGNIFQKSKVDYLPNHSRIQSALEQMINSASGEKNFVVVHTSPHHRSAFHFFVFKSVDCGHFDFIFFTGFQLSRYCVTRISIKSFIDIRVRILEF